MGFQGRRVVRARWRGRSNVKIGGSQVWGGGAFCRRLIPARQAEVLCSLANSGLSCHRNEA